MQPTRRAFLQTIGLLSAAAASIAASQKSPQAAPTYRPYRVGAHTIAVDDTQWDSRNGYPVRLWDGDRFIKQVSPKYLGRELIVPVFTAGGVEESRFRYTRATMTDVGITDMDAQYVSGPKWWTA